MSALREHAARPEWAQLASVCGEAHERVPPLFVVGSSASDLSALVHAFFAALVAAQPQCRVQWADAEEATSSEVLLLRLAASDESNECASSSRLGSEQFVAAAQRIAASANGATCYFVVDRASHIREFGATTLDLLLRLAELCRGANVAVVLVSAVPYALFPRSTRATLPFVVKAAPLAPNELRDVVLRSRAVGSASLADYFAGVFAPAVSDVDTAITVAERMNASVARGLSLKDAAREHLRRLVATDETRAAPISGSVASSTSLLAQQLMLAAFFAANTDRSVDDPLWSRTGAQLAKAKEIRLLEQPALFSFERLRHILELMCAARRSDAAADDEYESFLDEDLVLTEIASLVERGTLVRKWRALNDEQLKFRCTLTANDACAVAECLDACEAERADRRRGVKAAHGFVELMKSLL